MILQYFYEGSKFKLKLVRIKGGRVLKKFVTSFDMFPAAPILRVKGDPEMLNGCGGAFSLLLLIGFGYIFLVGIVNMLGLKDISSSQVEEMKRDDSDVLKGFSFALGLQQLKLTELNRFFSVEGALVSTNLPLQKIQMEPCQRSHWAKLDDISYAAYKMQYSYCPKNIQQIPISGFFVSEINSYLAFYIKFCNNATSPVECATQEQMDQLMGYNGSNYLVASFLALDTEFIPLSEVPFKFQINQKFVWLPFTQTLASELLVAFGEWEINTDTSFLPFQTIQTVKGFYVDYDIITRTDDVLQGNCLNVYVATSKKKKTFIRKYGKFDDNLSYLGGLFGIFISLFAFFVAAFNEYRYELWVSQSSFTLKDSKRIREKDFHFLRFVKYSIYDWAKLLHINLKWKDCQAIEETREQAIEQIEVQHLLRRIGHLEAMLSTLVGKEQDFTMYLVEPQPIRDKKEKRRIANYYNLITDGQSQTTIANLKMARGLMSSAVKISSQSLEIFFDNETSMAHIEMFADHQMTSLELIEIYLGPEGSSEEEKWRSPVQLDEQDSKCENTLTDLFYRMEENSRMQIVQHIPLPILSRLRKNYMVSLKNDMATMMATKERARNQKNKLAQFATNKLKTQEVINSLKQTKQN